MKNSIILNQLKISYTDFNDNLIDYVADALKISKDYIDDVTILKKSIDARKKPDIYYIFKVLVNIKSGNNNVIKKLLKNKNVAEYKPNIYKIPVSGDVSLNLRPVVIGMGPAGLFCAYVLAKAGYKPILLERGCEVDKRQKHVDEYWKTGVLNTESNVQFGEGGAGTFSDGKLNTLVKDKFGRNAFVLETFYKFGANEDILYDAKPHIGTDILVNVVKNMRNEIIALGGEVRFESKVDEFIFHDQKLIGIKYNNDNLIDTNVAVLAIGHSARDTFRKLHSQKVDMQAKQFAVGFRVEHPQDMIDMSQYGVLDETLPVASYKLTANLENRRGVYSFCMCPGGYVVNASSENGRLAVNGMSYVKRDSKNANSAIIISVGDREYDMDNPMSAIDFQENIEKKAYDLGHGKIPQQLFGDFENNIASTSYGRFESMTCGETTFVNLRGILSEDLNNSFVEAMHSYGHKIAGFDREDAILSGIESRTSSPVRITRDDSFQSNFIGLYPCGEGAGYAGGIMSAAMDGMKVAEKIIEKYKVNYEQ